MAAPGRIVGAALLIGAATLAWDPSLARGDGPRPEERSGTADASLLYNEGTDALRRDDLGPAVAWLMAARRIEPRAADIERNLGIARARAEALNVDAPERGNPVVAPSLPLSAAEIWWLAAALIALGAILGGAGALGGGRRLWTAGGVLALTLGAALWGMSWLRAREEARHPEAVVVVPVLSVGPSPDERPRAPYLIGAGETVRLGNARGGLVEIRMGGNAAGWASSAGLWRVGDCARYTHPPIADERKEPVGG